MYIFYFFFTYSVKKYMVFVSEEYSVDSLSRLTILIYSLSMHEYTLFHNQYLNWEVPRKLEFEAISYVVSFQGNCRKKMNIPLFS